MGVRIVMVVIKGANHFDVHEGESYADHLTWDEMLGCVAELTHPEVDGARFMKTPGQHDRWNERFRRPSPGEPNHEDGILTW